MCKAGSAAQSLNQKQVTEIQTVIAPDCILHRCISQEIKRIRIKKIVLFSNKGGSTPTPRKRLSRIVYVFMLMIVLQVTTRIKN